MHVEENETNVPFNNNFQSLLIQHLETLKEEFSKYFPEKPQLSNTLLRKPFAAKIENVPERYQEEFIDLITSDCTNTDFDSLTVNQFWIKQLLRYPNLAEGMLRILMPFPSTYMCEVTFSSLLLIKSKLRSKLHAEDDLRCAVSKTTHGLRNWGWKNSTNHHIKNIILYQNKGCVTHINIQLCSVCVIKKSYILSKLYCI